MPARRSAGGASASSAAASPSGGSLLAVVIDADPAAWAARASQTQDGMRFPDVLDDLLIFINAFLLLSGQNRLVAIASHPARSPSLPTPNKRAMLTARVCRA